MRSVSNQHEGNGRNRNNSDTERRKPGDAREENDRRYNNRGNMRVDSRDIQEISPHKGGNDRRSGYEMDRRNTGDNRDCNDERDYKNNGDESNFNLVDRR